MMVQQVLMITRRFHLRINAAQLLLDERVSHKYFIIVEREIRAKQDLYPHWQIHTVYFPNILLEVSNNAKQPCFLLSLNFRNYNYFPPEIGFLTLDYKLVKSFHPDAIITDDQGTKHLIKHNAGMWVCTPGTFAYHDFYFDLDRWELERYGMTCNIVELINRILAMINLERSDIIECASK